MGAREDSCDDIRCNCANKTTPVELPERISSFMHHVPKKRSICSVLTTVVVDVRIGNTRLLSVTHGLGIITSIRPVIRLCRNTPFYKNVNEVG
jgi:hypothetical protein